MAELDEGRMLSGVWWVPAQCKGGGYPLLQPGEWPRLSLMRCWMSATPRVGWSVRARRRFLRNRLWWRCSRPAGLAPATRGRRGRRPAPPGPGSRAAAGGPAGTRSALDAARERRGIGRVAARTAGPRPGAGARARRRHRRRGRSLARRGRPRVTQSWMRRRTGSVGGQGSRPGAGGTPRAGAGAQAA
jgi:hypothetical protein